MILGSERDKAFENKRRMRRRREKKKRVGELGAHAGCLKCI